MLSVSRAKVCQEAMGSVDLCVKAGVLRHLPAQDGRNNGGAKPSSLGF